MKLVYVIIHNGRAVEVVLGTQRDAEIRMEELKEAWDRGVAKTMPWHHNRHILHHWYVDEIPLTGIESEKGNL